MEINRKCIAAGFLIGIGNIINSSVDNIYIGALLFSCALLCIMRLGLPLFTGEVGYYDKNSFKGLLGVLIGNLLGVLIADLIILLAKPNLYDTFLATAIGKFGQPIYIMFILAFFCGICMYLAVETQNKIITVFAIMIFVLAGFEHCIADFPLLILNLSPLNVLKFVAIIAGNTAGAIFIRYITKSNKTISKTYETGSYIEPVQMPEVEDPKVETKDTVVIENNGSNTGVICGVNKSDIDIKQ